MAHSSYEYGLVGGIILQFDGWEQVFDAVSPSDLANAEAREMYEGLIRLRNKGAAIDSAALCHELGGVDTHWANTVSDAMYGGASDSPMTCARIVRQHAMHRELHRQIAYLAQTPATDDADAVSARIESLQKAVNGFANGSGSIYDIAANSASVVRFRNISHDTGKKCGIDAIDYLYRQARGLLTVVTGAPGSGKSEFVDALLCLLAAKHNLRFAIFSPENYPKENHVLKLVDKMFGVVTNKRQDRMTHGDMSDDRLTVAVEYVGKYFSLVDLQDGDSCLDALIHTLDKEADRLKFDGFVIDPWNELEAKLRPGERETDYIGRCLARLRRWARKRDIMLWIVAHPTKLKKDDDGKYAVPTPYDISGSANWYNKADNALSIYRHNGTRYVDVHVQKIKQKLHGEKGIAELVYDNKTGCYYDKRNCPASVMADAKDYETQEAFGS